MKNEFIPLSDYKILPEPEMIKRSENFYEEIKKRRTIREFSDKPVPVEIINNGIKSAGQHQTVPIFNPGILLLLVINR